MDIRIPTSTGRRIAANFIALELPIKLLLEWKCDVEFDIDERREEKLHYVVGGDAYYEYRVTRTYANRTFRVIWELELDPDAQVCYLLDLSLIEKNPQLAKNRENPHNP